MLLTVAVVGDTDADTVAGATGAVDRVLVLLTELPGDTNLGGLCTVAVFAPDNFDTLPGAEIPCAPAFFLLFFCFKRFANLSL